ncbi:MAG: MATE family efflux transporter [Candidatus Marinimicrobia bacterium]|nr:MATE family efflux transporter [Candidatus Neomarinimicrobiota bacterium]
MKNRIKKLWIREAGYKELLIIAFPLIIATGIHSIQHFIDRLFLSWYSAEAIAAAMPASMLNFTLLCFFLGIAGYTNTFVSQYNGAKKYKNIGKVIWNGLLVSLIGGIVVILFIPFADEIFSFIGHSDAVIKYEVQYFRIVNIGAFPAIAGTAISGFFSGTNRTKNIMWISLFAMIVNIVLDYIMIFGNFGFPELGMRGAAIATVISHTLGFLLYFILINKKEYKKQYNIYFKTRIDYHLFKRFIKYGLPNGVHFFIELLGFTMFVLIIGRIDLNSLAATNIAFNLNNLIFLPMIGMGITVTVQSGKYIGAKKIYLAERATYSGLVIILLYVIPVIGAFLLFPEILINMFSQKNTTNFDEIRKILFQLIKFMAIYSIFDVFNITFSATLKGAGDTKFIMYVIAIFSVFLLIIPTFIAVEYFDFNIYYAWTILTFFVSVLGLAFLFRFKQGKWKSMNVIEETKHKLINIPMEESFENM